MYRRNDVPVIWDQDMANLSKRKNYRSPFAEVGVRNKIDGVEISPKEIETQEEVEPTRNRA